MAHSGIVMFSPANTLNNIIYECWRDVFKLTEKSALDYSPVWTLAALRLYGLPAARCHDKRREGVKGLETRAMGSIA